LLLRVGKAVAIFAMSQPHCPADETLLRKIYSMKVVHLKECAAAIGVSTGGASDLFYSACLV